MINLRLALRSLLKTPLVTGVAILSLALGTGANAGIFSLFEQMLLRALPVDSPERLVNLASPGPKPGSVSTSFVGDTDEIFSYPMFRDLEKAETGLSGVAAHCPFAANLAYSGNTLAASGLMVSGSYFETLGLQPALGRLFHRDDDQVPGAHPVAVLAHDYWTSRFNQDPDVLGKSLVVNGQPMTIIGVAPHRFKSTSLGHEPRVYVPISMREQMTPGWRGFDNRRKYWVYLFGRLDDGVSVAQATAAIDVVYSSLIRDVEASLQTGMSDATLERFKAKQVVLEPGRRGQSEANEMVSAPLSILLGVSAFVLLIACANIANLLLVKATQRSGEIALRMSIGARRSQVVAQLLTESFVLAMAGSLVGLLAAHATLRLFLSFLPSGNGVGPTLSTQLGPATWFFLGVLTVITGLTGLFPALHTTRHDLAVALKSQSNSAAASRTARRFRTSMASLQIALSMALLASAGLFTRSLVNASQVELGIEVERVATFGLSPELNGYEPAESRNLFERVESELGALPGVEGAVVSMVPLITSNNWSNSVSVQGFAADPDTDTEANYNEIGPGYFRTLGIPVLAGRELQASDTLDTPRVAVVNEAFARKFGLGRDVIGKRIGVGSGDELDTEIVGLVKDTKYSEVKRAVPATYFVPYRQNDQIGAVHFYVRSPGDPAQLLASVRGAVSRLDPNLPIVGLRTMEAQVLENLLLDRILSTLSGAFAILATLLAAIGLYGVMAYSVAQRTREIGLRMALGADAGRVRKLVLHQVGGLTAVGAVAGMAAALGLGHAARSLLFELEGHDPAVFVAAALVLGAVALTAGLVPAHRATQIDPMTALRQD